MSEVRVRIYGECPGCRKGLMQDSIFDVHDPDYVKKTFGIAYDRFFKKWVKPCPDCGWRRAETAATKVARG